MIQKNVRIFVLKCVRPMPSYQFVSNPLFPYIIVNTIGHHKSVKTCALFFNIYTMENNHEDEFESAKKSYTKRLSVTISAETYDRLKSYVEANGYDTSKLVDKILQKFLDVKK